MRLNISFRDWHNKKSEMKFSPEVSFEGNYTNYDVSSKIYSLSRLWYQSPRTMKQVLHVYKDIEP